MKTIIPRIISLAAMTGLLAVNSLQAQTTDPLLADSVDQAAFPQITVQPVDQTVLIGSSVVFSVQANNADGYQWLIDGIPADGQTNTSLTIASAGTGDVGFYSCEVFNGSEMIPTRTATLNVETAPATTVASASVNTAKTTKLSAASTSTTTAMVSSMPMTAGGPITVFGMPYAGGGSQGSCPGHYTGYVAYSKTVSQGWGWSPISGAPVLMVADASGRTDTKIQYVGAYGDYGCAQTSVTINVAYSPVYRFTIYFTNNIPTNAYPITLTGFNP